MTELQKVIAEMRKYVGESALIRDWESRLEAYQQRMGEPTAWMNSLNGVVISNIAEDGSKINLVRMAEYGFDTPLYTHPEVEQQPTREPVAWAEIGEDQIGAPKIIDVHLDPNKIQGEHRRLPLCVCSTTSRHEEGDLP